MKSVSWNSKILCVLGLAGALSLSGCALLRAGGFQKPKLRFKQLHLRDVSFAQMTLDFEFELQNPNPVGVTFASLSYQLDVDSRTLAKGTAAKGLALKASATSPLLVPFTVEYKELAGAVHALLTSKSEVPYRLQAGFGIKTPVGVVTIPIDHAGRVPLPRLPAVKVARVELKQLGLTGATLEFELGVTNRAGFPILGAGAGYSVDVAGVQIGAGDIACPALQPQASGSMTVPLSLSFFKLGRAAVKAVRSKKLPYRFSGSLDLGPLKHPFVLEGVSSL